MDKSFMEVHRIIKKQEPCCTGITGSTNGLEKEVKNNKLTGGKWTKDSLNRDTFTPYSKGLKKYGADSYRRYFAKYKPGVTLNLISGLGDSNKIKHK